MKFKSGTGEEKQPSEQPSSMSECNALPLINNVFYFLNNGDFREFSIVPGSSNKLTSLHTAALFIIQ